MHYGKKSQQNHFDCAEGAISQSFYSGIEVMKRETEKCSVHMQSVLWQNWNENMLAKWRENEHFAIKTTYTEQRVQYVIHNICFAKLQV